MFLCESEKETRDASRPLESRPLETEVCLLVAETHRQTQPTFASVARLAFPSAAVFVTGRVDEALGVLEEHIIDIALIDLDLPDGSGIDVLNMCMRLSPITRCVIGAMCDDDEHIARALSAGALGYLLKDQPEVVLVHQVQLIADGIPPLAPSIARRLLQHFAEMRSTGLAMAMPDPAQLPDNLARLSEREQQVLTLIAKGMQIAEVAQLLAISANTVCSHVKHIYRKRNLASRAEAALEARYLGLV